MEKTGVIFDFDGVIINSVELQRKSFYESYEKHVGKGIPPFKEFLTHSGNSLINIFQIMQLPDEMRETYINISKNNMGMVTLYSGMKELVKELDQKGIICCLLTGKESKRTIKMLEMFYLKKYFRKVVCSDMTKYAKPHREGIDLCLESCELKKENTIMVGDAVNDILCARNAEVKSIAVSWGESDMMYLKTAKPDYIAETRENLKDIIYDFWHCKEMKEVS